MQCQPVPVIWQPDNLVDEQNSNFTSPVHGLLASWPLVTGWDTTVAVDLGDESGILGPLSAWGIAPTPLNDNPFTPLRGSAVFDGTQSALRTDSPGQLNQASLAFTGWFKFNNKTGAQRILHYGPSVAAYTLRYSSVQDRLNWHILDAGGTHEVIAQSATLGAPVLGTWYFFYVWYDAATKTAGIQVIPDGLEFSTAVLPITDTAAVPFGKNPAASALYIATGPALEKFKGGLYDISTWNRLLNPLELRLVYGNSGYGWPVFTPAAGQGPTPTTPTTPSDLLVVSGSISFTDNTGGLYEHEIWRDDGTGSTWTLIATLELGVTNYEDPDWTALNSYRVRAIGRGNPSPFDTFGGIYYMSDGRALLKADDGQWYSVGLSTDYTVTPKVTTLDIDQAPSAEPAWGAEFILFYDSGSDSTYGFRLVLDEDEKITFGIDQDPTGLPGTLPSLALKSDDARLYTLSLVNENGTFTEDIAQTAVGEPDAPVLLATNSSPASSLIDAEWTDPAEGTFTEVQFNTDGATWQSAGVVDFGVTQLEFNCGVGAGFTITVRVRTFLDGLDGVWSNLKSTLLLP